MAGVRVLRSLTAAPAPNGRASALVVACALAVVSCNSDKPGASKPSSSPSGGSDTPVAVPPTGSALRDSAPLGTHEPHELIDAAKAIVAFLRGEAGFDRIRLADTVTLYLGPEAGGARRTIARATLRERSNWSVRSGSLPNAPGMSYAFAPPQGRADLTTRVGRHLRCIFESPLSSIFPELAQFPHVGTMLAYGTGCLQTQNLTLVFDPTQKPPTLIAAIYDQFEW